MTEIDTRPLYLTDAKSGQGIAGNRNYIIGNPTNFDKIQWECDNAVGIPRLNQKKNNPPEGYEWSNYFTHRTWKGKSMTDDDGKLAGRAVDFCLGDAWPFSWVDRKTNRYKRKYDRKNKAQCCLNKFNSSDKQKLCDPDLKFNTAECDDTVRKWCAENPKDPACGCLLPSEEYAKSKLLGPPECIDARCVGEPKAYKTQSQINRKCPNIVNCVIDKTIIEDIKDSNISGLEYEQNCGMTLEEAIKMVEEQEKKGEETITEKEEEKGGLNIWAWILGIIGGIFIIIGIFLLVFRRSSYPPNEYYQPPPNEYYQPPPNEY